MENKSKVKIARDKILSRLKEELSAHSPTVLNISGLTSKIEEDLKKGLGVEDVVNEAYPLAFKMVLNHIAADFVDDDGLIQHCNMEKVSFISNDSNESKEIAGLPADDNLNSLTLNCNPSLLTSDAHQFGREKEMLHEVNTISKLLPQIKKFDIYNYLKLLQSNENRKVEVLKYFIELSLEMEHTVSEDVFLILTKWQSGEDAATLVKHSDAENFTRPDLKMETVDDELKKKQQHNIFFLTEMIPTINQEEVVLEMNKCRREEDFQGVIVKFIERNLLESTLSLPDKMQQNHKKVDDSVPDKSKNDNNCEILSIINPKTPVVIELDDRNSPSSDIELVGEVGCQMSGEIIIEDNNYGNSIESPMDCEENFVHHAIPPLEASNVTELSEKVELKQEAEEEPEAIMWEEARSICGLLPFLLLSDVQQSLTDNFYHPNRRCIVLQEYYAKALEDNYRLDSLPIYSALSSWNTTAKRPLIGGANPNLAKRVKYSAPIFEQPIPSTSKAAFEPLALKHEPFVAEQTHSAPNAEWFRSKSDFLSETFPLVNRADIESQVANCMTEADIIRLSEELINCKHENDSSNTEPFSAPSTSTANQHLNIPSVSSEPSSTTDKPSDDAIDDQNTNPNSAADIEDRIQVHIQQLGEMFSNADPDFIAERANEVAGDAEKFYELVMELTKNHTYPKLEEYLKRQKKMEMRKKFIEGMSVEEFLQYFEDPEKVFSDTTKVMSNLYCKNAKAQLMKDLPYHFSKTIDIIFKGHNNHYLPSLRALRKQVGARKTKRPVGGQQPGDLDDIFIKELCYAKLESRIKEHHLQKEEEKKIAFQVAKDSGQLKECQCCYDDEFLEVDMSSCDNGDSPHYFCNTCIKRYSEEQIGQGKLEFLCLQGECKSPFSLNTLKTLLIPSIFSNLLKRKQAEEIAAAEIEDLESCPFCNFATIMPNKENKVFKCLNPECLKDSCRLCKEPNHIPLRCEEIEKKKQTEARTYLENEMTEAMVRECYKCKKRFIKEEGCNKMQCSCGALMCYLCKKPIKGYNHFRDDPSGAKGESKCPLWSNSLKLHAEEVQMRAQKAKEKLDPKIELVHDPTNDLPQVPDYLKKTNKEREGHLPGANRFENPIGHMNPNAEAYTNAARLALNELDQAVVAVNRVLRHTHRHRHHHFYIPMQQPQILQVPPPAHIHPAHLPPPPPAHQRQLNPPNPFNLDIRMDPPSTHPLIIPMPYPPPRRDHVGGGGAPHAFHARPPHRLPMQLHYRQFPPLDAAPIQHPLPHLMNHPPVNPPQRMPLPPPPPMPPHAPPPPPPPPYHHHHHPPPLHQPASPWQPLHPNRRGLYNSPPPGGVPNAGIGGGGGGFNDHRERHPRHQDNHNHMQNPFQSPNRHRDHKRF